MIFLKNHPKLGLFIFSLLVFGLSFILGHLLSQPFTMSAREGVGTTFHFFSRGTINRIYPRLVIQVSPPGYPSPGKEWEVSVFEVSLVSDSEIHRPASNSNVTVVLRSSGMEQVFYLRVDDNAQATFLYRPEYSDIAFQAFQGDLSSQTVILSKHYVSSDVVDNLLRFNILALAVSVVSGGFILRQRKIDRVAKGILLLDICLFAFVMVFSAFSKLFQGTAWGFPENIVGGVITITLLRYLWFIGLIVVVLVVPLFGAFMWLTQRVEKR